MCNLNKQKPAMLLLALTRILTLAPNRIAAAGPGKGENRHAFGLLCEVVTALSKIPEDAGPSGDAQEAAQNAEHISLILSEYKTITKLTDNVAAGAKSTTAGEELPAACQEQNRAKCTGAAEYLKKLPDEEKLKLKHAAEDVHGLTSKLNHTLKQMKSAGKLIIPAESSKRSTLKGHLTQAIYGEPNEPPTVTLKGAGSNRQTHCGTGGTARGTSAKLSIVATLTCLCASDASATTNKACFKTPTGNQDFSASGRPITVWTAIQKACETEAATTPTKALPDLGTLHRQITALLYEPKGDDGAIGFIGAVTGGNSAGDCDGAEAGGTGACATFTSAANTIEIPDWLNKLKDAANAQAEHTAAMRAAALAETQLMALNESLTTLLQLNAKPPSKAPVPGSQTAQKQEVAEKECNNLETKTDCNQHKNPKCKWTKPNVEAGKYCELNETKVTEQATQTGQDGAAGAPAATGCARHGTDKTACENDKTGDKQNCAWRKGKEGEPEPEKEMCRNGSFLLNKQFALTVVSAAFVALLF
uniref:Variant surface glycoprotein 1125.129 n=1 Tax=Trypanosoma brucei TaxID=5691 RepID=A0A1J0R593_9TRYP|nr:variant surface glycoprotein 1125.129 [Trypanosoma brucei]